MQSVVFQSEIKENRIEIPYQYRDLLGTSVMVTLFSGSAQKSKGDFAAANIDTSEWKFNRDEANER